MNRSASRVGCAIVALAAASCAAHHQARGLVLHVDPTSSTLTVSHDDIPGYMDGMVMPFRVSDPSALAEVRRGDRVAFRITVRKGAATIDRLTLLSAAPADTGIILSPSAPALVTLGQKVPDFSLTDQRGREVSLASLRGSVVALTFIYTRCPLPDYCPRIVANLRALADRFPDRLGRDLALVSITFDPKYDTPEQLVAYARASKADGPGWWFLTGTGQQIGRVCSLFGVEFWPDEGLITHTLQMAVIDRDGRLAATVEGRDYSARQLGDLIERILRE